MLGYSRQYFYKHCQQTKQQLQQARQVKELVARERKILPRLGTRKLYHLIRAQLESGHIRFGRDKLFNLLRENQLLILPHRRYVQTTFSKHWLRQYPNLIKDLVITQPDQVWVSDITYVKTDEGTCYLNLVTDACSRKIMGYALADNMEAKEMKQAFEMALGNRENCDSSLIHHSDRGVQYCSAQYVALAQRNTISMSMTQNGDPYENALAERMNRTLKEEFGLGDVLPTRLHARLLVQQAVEIYNNRRPHLSLLLQTPQSVHQKKSQSFAQLGSS